MIKYLTAFLIISSALSAANVFCERNGKWLKLESIRDGKCCKIYHEPQNPERFPGRGKKKDQHKNNNKRDG